MSEPNGVLAGARVLAISIGKAIPLVVARAGTEAVVMSGIRKHPVSTLARPLRVQVRPLGVAGDEQADLAAHGGPDKAVYAYPSEHYAWWNARRRAAAQPEAHRGLPFGAMGENLTIEGLDETDLWVGDMLSIGTALLRVASPRQPSCKFNAVLGYRHAVRDMVESGYSGVYLSVVRTGEVRAGDAIYVHHGPRKLSIDSINRWRRDGRRQLF
ncbi:MOSC domain-containing protein [Cupriavidus sp. WKF15]|uniref:MOSC domain-containing protein n=1 Tax=Cupriavidus sp. WKF15 TaxID=3032282 RepID=UPI0023E0DDE4|nr:MOSC domain-containing protein [Cupriavidus sp. WKF15]WER45982.1 MOSC domain-containing protein [Cupriavidus sp. WKF15]